VVLEDASVNVSQIDETYGAVMREAAISRRAAPQYGIRELLAKPPFSGFIDVSFLNDLPLSMFLCENDDGVALRCLWTGSFEPMSIAIWCSLVRQTQCAIDVGAHSGLYSLAGHAVNDAAQIVSLEPYSLNFSRLVLNLKANRSSIGGAINAAASDKSGVVSFSVSSPPGYLTSGGSVSTTPGAAHISVPCVTLDKIVIKNNLQPGVIKIDVEGHELQVLRGSEAVFDTYFPDLIIECVFSHNATEIERFLTQRGYRFYVINDAALTLDEVDSFRPSSGGTAKISRLNRFVTKRNARDVLRIQAAAHVLLRV